jgi:hypothetical protein
MAVVFIVVNQRFQEEPTSQVLRIMTLSRLMHERKQSDTRRFAVAANRPAAQPVCPESQNPISGISGSQGLRSGESPYPLRT